MRKAKLFFHPIDGLGALTISWSSRPKGDAVEAKKGSGVGFFSKTGSLLCVIFDEVQSDHDHQILEFERNCIEITVKDGQIAHTVTPKKSIPRLRKKPSQRKATR